MYLSHKYKFLFLRTPKTASSSLSEFFIRNIPDPDAIYTHIEDSKMLGTLDPAISEKYHKDWQLFHLTVELLIKEGILTLEQAKEYKIVNVLRNPFDRQKSFYYFYKKWWQPRTPGTDEEYLHWTFDHRPELRDEFNSGLKQTSFSKYNGETLGEYWLYEDLEKELNNFMDELGLEITSPLPNHKAGFRKNKDQEFVFSQRSIDRIRHHFKEDCETYERLKKG